MAALWNQILRSQRQKPSTLRTLAFIAISCLLKSRCSRLTPATRFKPVEGTSAPNNPWKRSKRMHPAPRMSSPADPTTKHHDSRSIEKPVNDVLDVTVVDCTADSSSITMSRRQQVVQAVRKPVSRGSRQCVNVLKELLPQEVLHEIQQQVSSGVKPFQAVESVTQQRMGPQVAADVTKLFMAVSLASSAGGGVVTATKAILCLLAAPLYLGGPMRALTNILLPTPVAGGLLGCCIVLHTAREVMANDNQQQQHKGEAHTASPSSSAAAADAADAATDSSSGGSSSSNVKRRNHPWWALWKRNSRQKVEQSSDEAQASNSAAAAAAGGPAAAAAAAGEDECGTAAAERAQSPEGPCTPDAHSVLCSKGADAVSPSADQGIAPDAAAEAETAAAAAVASGAFSNQRHGLEAHPLLPSANLLSLDSYDDADVTVTAAVANDVTNSDAGDANGIIRFKQPKQQQPAPLPLSPTNSLRAALDGLRTPSPAAAAAAAQHPSTLPYQVQLRRRSSSGAADLSGEPLSPTSSGAYSPREDIEGQAAEVQRRWSMGHHDDMIPHPQSFKMLQDQPYRPPVFTRLSSGRGGCRITAAAAAAAAKQQQQQQHDQQQRRLSDSGSGGAEGGLRQYHSLDIKWGPEGGQQQQSENATTAAAAAAAAPAGADGWGMRDNAPSAPLPPLPGITPHGIHHVVSHGSSDGQLHGEGSGELPMLSKGVVRQRSLDWGHKLCKTYST